jgi:hypothetical protein
MRRERKSTWKICREMTGTSVVPSLTAIDGFAEEYAREAIVGDTDWEPRYANESYTQFQGAEGTVTFDILKRQVSLEATASVKSVEVTEDAVDVSETWEIGKTEKAA